MQNKECALCYNSDILTKFYNTEQLLDYLHYNGIKYHIWNLNKHNFLCFDNTNYYIVKNGFKILYYLMYEHEEE